MKVLDNYLKFQKELFAYFGYVEDWVAIPIDDARDYYWFVEQGEHGAHPGKGRVGFAESKEVLMQAFQATGGRGVLHVEYCGLPIPEAYYENSIYTQRFLPKWVYEGEEYTMICVDTHTDGNKFLQIFDNSKKMEHWIQDYLKSPKGFPTL